MEAHDLRRLVALGEGQHIEFKRRMPRPERLAREAIALANAQGGRVLLGVGDDGEIVGVRDAAEEEFALRRAMEEHCDPPVNYLIESVPVTAKREVLVVDVPESPLKPHFLVIPDNGVPGSRTAFVRVGHQSIEASREAVRLMKKRGDRSDVRFEFGEKERALMRYLDRHERITVEQFATLADIPVRLASHTLVLLSRANLLRLHPGEREDYFTLAYDVAD
jgi:predicted HTH transcriptional regulator